MALITRVVQREEIPHEAGESMEFRRLSWQTLQAAREARNRIVFTNMRAMGGEMVRELRSLTAEQPDSTSDAPALPEDPIGGYDWKVVLEAGIVSWSYSVPVRPQTIADLDEETAEWAVRRILHLSGIGRDTTDRKND